MKKAFIISGVFISGLIGAGFASGSEILFYFSRYSTKGLLGIILAVFIFSFIQHAVISQSSTLKTYNLDSYLKIIMPKPFYIISSVVSYLFMMIVFCAMLAGSGELFGSLFGIKRLYGVLLMLLCTHCILSKGYKGFISAQSFLSVIIIFSILFFSIYILFFREKSVTVFNPQLDWGISSVSYASYNLLTSTAILCILAKDCDFNTSRKASLITFTILLPILTVLWYIICLYNGMIDLGAMPLLTIAMRQSGFLGYSYSVTIFISMLTTAVSNSYALITRLCDFSNKKTAYAFVMSTGFFASAFDFEFIVDKLYRFTGILSVFILLTITKKYFIKK